MCKKVHGVADTVKSNSAVSKTINTNFQRFSLQFKEAVSRYSRHPFHVYKIYTSLGSMIHWISHFYDEAQDYKDISL